MKNRKPLPLAFAGLQIHPGEKKRIEIPVSRLPTQTWVSIPVQVIYGEKPGPCIALISGIHGDEINGMEVMRELVPHLDPKTIRGSIIMVPVVNVFGFLNNERYLPDRRDLNRCFPGNPKGSMGARLAHLFTQEILHKADYLIDFHTATVGRMNYPHVRTNLRLQKNAALAKMFGAEVIMHTSPTEGTLRDAARKYKCQAIVFEGGGPNVFNNEVIQKAVSGTWSVLQKLKICMPPKKIKPNPKSKLYKSSTWVRAHRSGIFRLTENLGDEVEQKQPLGIISNIFGDTIAKVKASQSGTIIGMATDPKVHKGEAIVHIAKTS
ncbi:MAG: succinylglutamate desuccinylase/aspartoacylase family protein [Deltaproteobacteria bacterium]|nr:succinylglutamate desuccinylase/aspartoacylase family protein [Deltaproteobacteria bacterium]